MRARAFSHSLLCSSPRAYRSHIFMSDRITYMSAEGLEKIKAELLDLKTVKRRELAERISVAKSLGDLSENAEYHEARDNLAFVEGRILEIEEMLKNVSVIQTPQSHDVVSIGSTVVVDVSGKERTYTIVGSNEADPAAGLISNESPLGSAFLGRRIGESVEVDTPGGVITYKIISVA